MQNCARDTKKECRSILILQCAMKGATITVLLAANLIRSAICECSFDVLKLLPSSLSCRRVSDHRIHFYLALRITDIGICILYKTERRCSPTVSSSRDWRKLSPSSQLCVLLSQRCASDNKVEAGRTRVCFIAVNAVPNFHRIQLQLK